MSTVRLLSRNIFSSWTGFAVHALVTLWLTPFIIDAIGKPRYGIWILVSSITGYYGLLDLGFRPGLTQYLARYLAQRDIDKLNATASTGFVALSIVGMGVLVPLSFLMAALAPLVFQTLPDDAVFEARICLVIVGCTLGCSFVFFLFSSVLSATQRYDLASVIGVTTRIIYAILVVALLRSGFGLIAIAVATAITNLIDYLLRWRVARYVLPELRISPRKATWQSCREFMTFGLWNVVISTSRHIISYTDALVIGVFRPMEAVAHFALASQISNQFGQLLTPASTVFFPELTRLDAQANNDAKQRVLIHGSRFLVTASLGMGIVFFVTCREFYPLWISPAQITSTTDAPAPILFRVLLLAQLATFCQGISRQLLLGARKTRQLATIFAFEAGLNLLLSVVLIQWFGLLGVAVATVIGSLIFQAIVLPIYVLRITNTPTWHYLATVWIRPSAVAAVVLPSLLYVDRFVATENWWQFLAYAGLLTLVVFTAFGLVVTNRQEKARFLIGPMSRWMKARQG